MNNKLLIPRRIEERQHKRLEIDQRRIQQYINNGCVGNLNLKDILFTKLPDEIRHIEGDFIGPYEQYIDFNKLEVIKNDCVIYVKGCNLSKLRHVGGYLDLSYIANIHEIPETLKYVGGVLNLKYSGISEKYILNNLLKRKDLFIGDCIVYWDDEINKIKKIYKKIREKNLEGKIKKLILHH